MSNSLLLKTRALNKILQNSGARSISFNELCKTINEILEANVYIINKRGKILGSANLNDDESLFVNLEEDGKFFSAEDNKGFMGIDESMFNLTCDQLSEICKNKIDMSSDFATIVPIIGNASRLGTFIISRKGDCFKEEDLILSEYAATIVGTEIVHAKTEEEQSEARKKAVVEMAISTLSYSELDAIVNIVAELDGTEGLVVASKIADKAGITRSVIVNALRKLESASIIDSKSLGMKGTYIRILNNKLVDELAKQSIY